MRRVVAAAVTSVLVAAAVLRSHLLPLSLLVLLAAVVGILIAVRTQASRDLRRLPVLVALVVLVLVGVGQLGAPGVALGVLLVAIVPASDRHW